MRSNAAREAVVKHVLSPVRYSAAKSFDVRTPRSRDMQAAATLLVFVWLAMVVVGGIGLVRGHLDWARIRNRKQAGGLLAASFLVLLLIGVITPEKQSHETTTPPSNTPAPATQTTAASTTPTATITVEQPPPQPFVPAPASTPAPAPTAVPAPPPAPAPTPTAAPAPPRPPSSASVFYPDCDAARAAGAAPLRRGEPGYRPQLDSDHDGVACEVRRR
ncbi:excalibur calcium-binding domain-containing protein [Nocardia sp. NPDC057455]|uniref:excalibur calcium-binding domain-containing protein n=1 Tax=Nocardia sp. NPDC057455 TaxID=3346138 RepID=UPI00366FA489